VSLTPESLTEHKAAVKTKYTLEEIQQLKYYNRLYKEKFGFPFVICPLLNKKDTILRGIQTRLSSDGEGGIEEVKKIMLLMMKGKMGRLKTIEIDQTAFRRPSKIDLKGLGVSKTRT